MKIARIAAYAVIGAFVVACETPTPVGQSGNSSLPPPIPSGSQSSSQSGSQSGPPSPGGSQSSGSPMPSGSQSGSSASSSGGMPAGGGAGGLPSGGGAAGGASASLPNPSGSQGGGQQAGDEGQEGGGADGAEGDGGESSVFGTGESFGSSGGEGDAFGDSLEDFDEAMGSEQEALARSGGGQAADETLERAAGSDGAVEGGGPGSQSGGVQGDIPDPRIVANATGAPQIEGCDDTDTTARQLCELASLETDPFLKADLWEEYNEYVRILQGR